MAIDLMARDTGRREALAVWANSLALGFDGARHDALHRYSTIAA